MARFSSIIYQFLEYDIGRLKDKVLHGGSRGGGVKNVILRMVYLNGLWTKSFGENLKPGIPSPLKCLAYNNIVFLHDSEISYDIKRFGNKWRVENGCFSN